MASGATVGVSSGQEGKGGALGELGSGAWVLDADPARSLANLGRICLANSPLRNPVLSLLDCTPPPGLLAHTRTLGRGPVTTKLWRHLPF